MELINNNQVPEGYKKTEVGVIPEDWETKLLGDIFCLKNGFSFKSEYFSLSGPIVLTPGNFNLDGGLYFNERNIKRYSGSFPESMTFKNGDLLVVMTDLTPDCNLLGKPAFVDSEETILHNQRIGKINLLSESIDKFFLYFILLSSPYLKKIKEQATGSTVRHTSNKSIYSISLPIPKTKEEQKAIASVLSDVDALIAALDKLITKKRNIKTATMQQLLTGKTRLPGFGEGKGYKKTAIGVIPEDWDVCYIQDLVEEGIIEKPLDGNHGNIHPKSKDFVPFGIPFIMSNNVQNGFIDTENCHFIRKEQADKLQKGFSFTGDVLLTHKGTVGNVAIVSNIPTEYIMLTPQVTYYRVRDHNRLTNNFIKFYFESSQFQAKLEHLSGGGTRAYIGITNQRKLLFLLPPFPEQQAIASVLSDIDSEITALEKRRAKTQAIKQGMMQELLTGKTRIINN
jgi:type I restriction enzyme S subunit